MRCAWIISSSTSAPCVGVWSARVDEAACMHAIRPMCVCVCDALCGFSYGINYYIAHTLSRHTTLWGNAALSADITVYAGISIAANYMHRIRCDGKIMVYATHALRKLLVLIYQSNNDVWTPVQLSSERKARRKLYMRCTNIKQFWVIICKNMLA